LYVPSTCRPRPRCSAASNYIDISTSTNLTLQCNAPRTILFFASLTITRLQHSSQFYGATARVQPVHRMSARLAATYRATRSPSPFPLTLVLYFPFRPFLPSRPIIVYPFFPFAPFLLPSLPESGLFTLHVPLLYSTPLPSVIRAFLSAHARTPAQGLGAKFSK